MERLRRPAPLPLTAITLDADGRPADREHHQTVRFILPSAVRGSRSLPPSLSGQARRGGGGVIRAAGRLQARFLTQARARSPHRAPVVYDASFAYDPEERRGVGSVIGLDGTGVSSSSLASAAARRRSWSTAPQIRASTALLSRVRRGCLPIRRTEADGIHRSWGTHDTRVSFMNGTGEQVKGNIVAPLDSLIGALHGEKRGAVKPPVLAAGHRG
ncbi:hypothetical protein AURDEDRAFT_170416 [Auricularia subglabra TFB-10046 SS5]|nr:hypothetical protein AURDEDRAFT_170416 [Auricularia subglabra TFB-10046 SS5]